MVRALRNARLAEAYAELDYLTRANSYPFRARSPRPGPFHRCQELDRRTCKQSPCVIHEFPTGRSKAIGMITSNKGLRDAKKGKGAMRKVGTPWGEL